MKTKYIFLFILLSSLIFSSCDNDDIKDYSVVEIPEESTNTTDIYINKNFIKPFNIDVKYKWNFTESDKAKNLVPPKEELIIPFLEVVLKAWIDPYVEISEKSGGIFLFPKYVPKMLFLLGSSGYNNDGTVTQGTAEGGKKIVLYEINKFDAQNTSVMQRYFHVMHHEFAHILHQTTEFSTEYQTISKGLYTSTWYLYDNEYANNNGFITNYAMSEYHEDFVEMIAMMLTRTKEEWDELMESMPESGKPQLLQKEQYVIDYFKNVWNIDIFELQEIINERLDEIISKRGVLKNDYKLNASGQASNSPYYSYEEAGEYHHCEYCLSNKK